MNDGMLLAEVMLYGSLLQRMETTHSAESREESDFLPWKAKWNHLLGKKSPVFVSSSADHWSLIDLPTASMLKVGYMFARIILTTRALQEFDEELSPSTLFSDDPSSSTYERKTAKSLQNSARDEAATSLRVEACGHAHTILAIFLRMPAHVKNTVGSNRCLVLVYSAMVLAHYDAPESRGRDRDSLDLIKGLNQWLAGVASRFWAVRLARVAQNKIMARINDGRETRTDEDTLIPDEDTRQCTGTAEAEGSTLAATGDGSLRGQPGSTGTSPQNTDFAASMAGMQDFDIDWGSIPNMEDFFSGGFLDFGFTERS